MNVKEFCFCCNCFSYILLKGAVLCLHHFICKVQTKIKTSPSTCYNDPNFDLEIINIPRSVILL